MIVGKRSWQLIIASNVLACLLILSDHFEDDGIYWIDCHIEILLRLLYKNEQKVVLGAIVKIVSLKFAVNQFVFIYTQGKSSWMIDDTPHCIV